MILKKGKSATKTQKHAVHGEGAVPDQAWENYSFFVPPTL